MAATKNYEAYASSATVACGIASLAAGSARESGTVANTTTLAFDYLVSLTFRIITGGPATTTAMAVNIYANGSPDGTLWPIVELSGGTPYPTGGGDSSVGALGSPPNLFLIGSFGLQSTTSSAERTFRTQPFSVAQAFGGNVPPAFSIVVENQTGIAFSATTTTANNLLEVQPIYSTSGN